MGVTSSRSRSGSGSQASRPLQLDLRPLLLLGTTGAGAAATEVTARELLAAVVEGDTLGAQEWARRLGEEGEEGLEAVATAISDPANHYHGLLHLAAAIGEHDMCALLISKYKLDVNATDACGATPLTFTIKGRKSTSVAELLLKNGADPNKADNNGLTPLHVAAQEGSSDCMKLLIKAGADVNAGTPITPFVVAADKGFVDCIKCLLKAGADATIPDEKLGTDEEENDRHEKLMGHFHSIISCLFSLSFPVMTAIFALETPLSDLAKVWVLTVFLFAGTMSIFGLIISTSLADRRWQPIVSIITLLTTIFSLGLFQFAVGLFFPKIEGMELMLLDVQSAFLLANVVLSAYLLANVAFFVGSSITIVLLWGYIFQTPQFLVLLRDKPRVRQVL